MKLSYFSSQTMPKNFIGSKDVPPAIHFNKAGVIAINKAGAVMIGITADDKISFAQDEETADWYVFKDNEHGYTVRKKDFDKGGVICFNHTAFAKSFLESFELDTTVSHRFLIAGTPTKVGSTIYFGILQVPNE